MSPTQNTIVRTVTEEMNEDSPLEDEVFGTYQGNLVVSFENTLPFSYQRS